MKPLRLWTSWHTEIAPPVPVVYVEAVAQLDGKRLRVHLTQQAPEPCVPLSMQFVQGVDGAVLRLPGVRQAKDREVLYDIVLPDTAPAGKASYWATEDYRNCGAYRLIETPHATFWIGATK